MENGASEAQSQQKERELSRLNWKGVRGSGLGLLTSGPNAFHLETASALYTAMLWLQASTAERLWTVDTGTQPPHSL